MVSMGKFQNKQPLSFLIRTYNHIGLPLSFFWLKGFDEARSLQFSDSACTIDVVSIVEVLRILESMIDYGPIFHYPDILYRPSGH